MDEQDQEVARNNRQADYVDRLQPGYRFCPTDTELIVHYLIPQIEKGAHPPCRLHKVNFYDHTPEDLAKDYCPCDANWYFLTPRTRKNPNGKRPSRTVKEGVGHWHASQSFVPVYRDDPGVKKQVVVGKKTSFSYQQGRNNAKTPWLMHEYTTNDPDVPLDESGQDGTKLTQWVICKIYMKPSENKKQIVRGRVLNYAKNDQDQAGGYDDQEVLQMNRQQQPLLIDEHQPSPKRQRLSSSQGDASDNQQNELTDQQQHPHHEEAFNDNNLCFTTNEQQQHPHHVAVQEYFHQDPTYSILHATTVVDDQALYQQEDINETMMSICPQPQVCETPTLHHQAFTTSDHQVQHLINGDMSTVYHHGLQSTSNNIAQYSSSDFYLTPQPTNDYFPYATTSTDHHDNATSSPLTPPTSPLDVGDYYTKLMTMDPDSPTPPGRFLVTDYWKDYVRDYIFHDTTIEYY